MSERRFEDEETRDSIATQLRGKGWRLWCFVEVNAQGVFYGFIVKTRPEEEDNARHIRQ